MKFHNGLELKKIGLNPPLRHHKVQELTRTDSERTLCRCTVAQKLLISASYVQDIL